MTRKAACAEAKRRADVNGRAFIAYRDQRGWHVRPADGRDPLRDHNTVTFHPKASSRPYWRPRSASSHRDMPNV